MYDALIKNFVVGASFFFSGLSSRAKVDANFEHVHSCCVLDDILAESVPSRIMLVTVMMILQYSYF